MSDRERWDSFYNQPLNDSELGRFPSVPSVPPNPTTIREHAEAILEHHQSKGKSVSWTFPDREYCQCLAKYPCKQREHAQAIIDALVSRPSP
jgi:hypothetical protein